MGKPRPPKGPPKAPRKPRNHDRLWRAALLKADGSTWDEIGARLGCAGDTAKQQLGGHERWDEYLERARQELDDEAAAAIRAKRRKRAGAFETILDETLHTLRRHLRGAPTVALQAAGQAARAYHQAWEREQAQDTPGPAPPGPDGPARLPVTPDAYFAALADVAPGPVPDRPPPGEAEDAVQRPPLGEDGARGDGDGPDG